MTARTRPSPAPEALTAGKTRTMRVLVADDAPIVRTLLQTSLERAGYHVELARDGLEALAVLRGPSPPRLAILDWIMPGRDGIDVCRDMREAGAEPYVYIILLSAKDDTADTIRALDAGADDFLRKPFDPAELEARLRAGRRIVDLHEALIAAREELRREARHDALTQVLNRRAIDEILEQEIARAQRNDSPLAVIFCDLDHFKEVNDRYMHIVGDAVLVDVAARLRSLLRPYDALGRWGGEEFVITLPGCDTQQALQIAERLRLLLAEAPVTVENGPKVSVTASFGVVATDTVGVLAREQLVSLADRAAYRAKDTGRNRVVLVTGEE